MFGCLYLPNRGVDPIPKGNDIDSREKRRAIGFIPHGFRSK